MGKVKRIDPKQLEQEIIEYKAEPKKEVDFNKSNIVSTGSTLLDLAISGKRSERGGVPGGIIVEVFGPEASGKTAIVAEICAHVQKQQNGQVMFLDPEGRLDQEYSEIYGLHLDEEDYHRPDTVTEVFQDYVWGWKPKNDNVVNTIAVDSLAALSTELEMSDKGDKMGMRRAKEFSQELRKTARIIANNKWLILCTNQVRQSEFGETTPGGYAIRYYSTLRIRVKQTKKIERIKKTPSGKDLKKIIGIESYCYIAKSTIDEPFRGCPISIIFGYGIDSIRDELQYYKDMMCEATYNCFDRKFQSIESAIQYIEDKNYILKLKQRTITLWNEIENKFIIERKKKLR